MCLKLYICQCQIGMGVLKYFKGSKNHYRFLILPGCEHSACHKCIKLKISKSELRLHMFGLEMFIHLLDNKFGWHCNGPVHWSIYIWPISCLVDNTMTAWSLQPRKSKWMGKVHYSSPPGTN